MKNFLSVALVFVSIAPVMAQNEIPTTASYAVRTVSLLDIGVQDLEHVPTEQRAFIFEYKGNAAQKLLSNEYAIPGMNSSIKFVVDELKNTVFHITRSGVYITSRGMFSLELSKEQIVQALKKLKSLNFIIAKFDYQTTSVDNTIDQMLKNEEVDTENTRLTPLQLCEGCPSNLF